MFQTFFGVLPDLSSACQATVIDSISMNFYISDSYDVSNYDDPDDFADDWADEFGDGDYDGGYDDAYDYWEENGN